MPGFRTEVLSVPLGPTALTGETATEFETRAIGVTCDASPARSGAETVATKCKRLGGTDVLHENAAGGLDPVLKGAIE